VFIFLCLQTYISAYIAVHELLSFQIGTHPLLTAAPPKYVLMKAAENAVSKLKA
jgi:hypothetical protein